MDNELINVPIEVQLVDRNEVGSALTGYTQVSLSDAASLGVAGEELVKFVNSINPEKQEVLYRAIFPKGVKGTFGTFKNEPYLRGEIVNEKNHIVSKVRWERVDPVDSGIQFDPEMFFMGLTMMEINSKLGEIIQLQTKLLEFEYDKEEATIRGNFSMLNEAVEKYPFNLEQESFINQNSGLVRNIKTDMYRSIELYRKQIEGIINAPVTPHLMKNAGKKVEELTRFIGHYHDSVNLLTYASYFEVLLMKNFSQGNLETVRNTLITLANDYCFMHEKCIEWSRSYLKSSANYVARPALYGVDKLFEYAFKKLPMDVDKLYENESAYYQGAEEQIKVMNLFKDPGTLIYIKEIKQIDAIHNEPLSIMVDNNNIYLPKDIEK